MPTYDYHCPANDRIVEVFHAMSETVDRWGRLCELAGLAPDGTPLDAPVVRRISGGAGVIAGSSGARPSGGGGCGSG